MKRLVFGISLLFLLLVFPSSIHAEAITNFTATLNVSTDSSLEVNETIQYDFGANERHGIYRTIPYLKTNDQGEKYQLDFSNFSVTNESALPYQFQKSSTNGEITLKIGDPNATIHGIHTYMIGYEVGGAFVPYSDHDELYWNIIGTSWEVPIQTVTATIQFPFTIAQNEMNLKCFTGTNQSSTRACNIEYVNGVVTVSTYESLAPNEGLTVVVGFPKNLLTITEAKKVDTTVDTIIGFIVSALFMLIGFLWYIALPIWIIVHWIRFGRDPKGTIGAAHVWFDVPKLENGKALSPGETGTLVDETVDLKDIIATVIDLARRGYLKIVEKKKNDFYLEKLIPKGKSTLESFEKKLYDGIFSKETSVRIKDTDLATVVTNTKATLYDLVVQDGLFPKNPQSQRILFYVLAGVALFTGNFVLAIVAFLFGRVMPRKTIAGVNATNIANALKGFIVSQDRQYKFQAEKQLLFEKMLPYAIVFGVEKIWAERFKDMNIIEPSWYQSYNHSTFTSIYLANSLGHSFSTSMVHAATPTRSSSGFSSGFSGGGFSGGGGGGGGGGSW